MRKLICLILVIKVFQFALFAATDNSTEIIGVSKGLPNSQVSDLLFGRHGLMWIGTTNGLCIYDGYNFTIKQSVPFDSTTLADDNIIKISQDLNNNIWLLTHYGLEFLNSSNLSNKRIRYIPEDSEVVDIIPSDTLDLFFLVFKDKIETYNINTLKPNPLKINIPFQIESALCVDHQLLVLGNGQLLKLNISNDKTGIVPFSINQSKDNSSQLYTFRRNTVLVADGKKIWQ